MKLTGRQLEFLRQVALLQAEESDDAIHYTQLAERLNVGNLTAYNMLKILEEKGCVESQYRLPEVRVGRSTVVHKITPLGRQMLK